MKIEINSISLFSSFDFMFYVVFVLRYQCQTPIQIHSKCFLYKLNSRHYFFISDSG